MLLCSGMTVVSCEDRQLDEGQSETSIAPVLDPVSEISDWTAVISGKVNVPSAASDSLEYGFQYCESKRFQKNIISVEVTELDSGNRFSVKIFPLTPSTSYYYRSYIKMDGVYVYSEVQSFETMDSSPTVPAGYKNLCKNYGANSYIVSESGSYCIPAVRGNNTNSSTGWLGNTRSVKVLWESFGTYKKPSVGDLIKSVFYEDGYIAFQTADHFKEGNAVIAAMGVEDEIIWSWHIWFTDQPQEHVCFNNAGIMMDRNLGAVSATPGDVGALGLLYQWGRKDPFLNAMMISSDEDLYEIPVAKSTIEWPDVVSSSSTTGTIEYAVANPTTLIGLGENADWCYSQKNNNLWSSEKSTYDPCPEGWRVPDGGDEGVWARALGVSGYFIDKTFFDQTVRGIEFSGKLGSAPSIWYPAAGYRNLHRESINGVGFASSYWTVHTNGSYASGLFFHADGFFSVSDDCPRVNCNSVRCAKE